MTGQEASAPPKNFLTFVPFAEKYSENQLSGRENQKKLRKLSELSIYLIYISCNQMPINLKVILEFHLQSFPGRPSIFHNQLLRSMKNSQQRGVFRRSEGHGWKISPEASLRTLMFPCTRFQASPYANFIPTVLLLPEIIRYNSIVPRGGGALGQGRGVYANPSFGSDFCNPPSFGSQVISLHLRICPSLTYDTYTPEVKSFLENIEHPNRALLFQKSSKFGCQTHDIRFLFDRFCQ